MYLYYMKQKEFRKAFKDIIQIPFIEYGKINRMYVKCLRRMEVMKFVIVGAVTEVKELQYVYETG